MKPDKAVVIVLVALSVGFAGGFLSRPIISPAPTADRITVAAPARLTSNEPRGTQYFVAHVDEAQRVVAGCRDGSVRGGECTTAEEAIIKIDAEERRRKFLGN
ncbi:hypothetical protein ACFB49_19330 [Sphingomonas sp. DBB INV C78]|uniref:hypothetical protein n=1 Tax=Sphingomonas sp. DBB INV C78 TaxID=3349434 RepID=UPI0036D346E4